MSYFVINTLQPYYSDHPHPYGKVYVLTVGLKNTLASVLT